MAGLSKCLEERAGVNGRERARWVAFFSFMARGAVYKFSFIALHWFRKFVQSACHNAFHVYDNTILADYSVVNDVSRGRWELNTRCGCISGGGRSTPSFLAFLES